jgi:pantothenate kinase
MGPALRSTVADLVDRARQLVAGRSRTLLGIAGAPGAGKSHLAAALGSGLGPSAVVIGMDGFHLAQAELERLGRADRKGAPDTFDPLGYAALLARVRANAEPVVYAPLFRRDLEEPIAGAVRVDQAVSCVVTEGNYLLLEDPAWNTARRHLDQVWYLDVPRALRQDRLIRRRMGFGVSASEARRWTTGSDERNAEIVAATRERADLVIEVVPE